MARDYANIATSIWGNPDVRALPPMQQWLYLQMWTHPDLTYAGVLDWRPRRNLAPLSAGTSADEIAALIPMLQERRFVVLDEETEEILMRSYFRHDGLLKNPKTAVSMVNAYSSTGSNMLRETIIWELLRLRDEHPEWAAWGVARVVEVLKHPASNPFASPSVTPLVTGKVTPLVTPKPSPSVTSSPTATATTTATEASLLPSDEAEVSGPRRPATRLPRSWAPTAEHVTRARVQGLDLAREVEAFRDHAETHDRHAASWNGAFTTWLKKARPSQASSAGFEVPEGQEWMLR